jgi:hypothetical protein
MAQQSVNEVDPSRDLTNCQDCRKGRIRISGRKKARRIETPGFSLDYLSAHFYFARRRMSQRARGTL